MAAPGDGCADVGVRVLVNFYGRRVEQPFKQVVSARNAEFFGEDAERILAGDEVDPRDAGVGFEGAEQFASEDCAGCAGEGYCKVHRVHVERAFWRTSLGHTNSDPKLEPCRHLAPAIDFAFGSSA